MRPTSRTRTTAAPQQPVSVLDRFCRLVLMRSRENGRAVLALHGESLPGQVIGVLRQELDSVVRVLYLIETEDREYRERLMRATLDGEKWPKARGNGFVTDSDMVKAAARQHGWAGSVYKFGCAFIHLSANHDSSERDPFKALPAREQADILDHLRYNHGGPLGVNIAFTDVVAYLPRVYGKIATNLCCHVDELKARHGH